MRRGFGLALLLLSAFMFSAEYTGGKKRELRRLQDLCLMLEQLRGLLDTQAPPMPELLTALAGRCEGEAAVFAERLGASMDRLGQQSFSQLWTQTLLTALPGLEEDVFRELASLGKVLGHFGLETQCETLDACLLYLRQRRRELEERFPQSLRLSCGLSLSGALLLAILLI